MLLHLTELDDYDLNTIFENPKLKSKSKKRYLDNEISKLAGGYNKTKLNFARFEPGIPKAIARSKNLPLDNMILIDQPGTTVCLLVEKLMGSI